MAGNVEGNLLCLNVYKYHIYFVWMVIRYYPVIV